MPPNFSIRPFNVKAASPGEYSAWNRHINLVHSEKLPDDPPIPLEESIKNMQNIPPFLEVRIWAAWSAAQDEIIAHASLTLFRREDNRHLAPFDINVQPPSRRQGLGRTFLRLVVHDAQEDNRRLLVAQTIDRIPAGAAFMQRIGAQSGMEAHTNQLRTEDIDPALLEKWLARGRELSSEFSLGSWEDAYPESELPAIAELTDLSNEAPRGDLEIEEMHTTPEQLRQAEQNLFARGCHRWTYYLADRLTGKLVGYTETIWNPNRPQILEQDMTAVHPDYRNRGLGRWLKAAMLEKVLKDRSRVRFVRTGNADMNFAMLKINNELGFRPYFADTFWQVGIDRLQEYLAAG